eukprot:3947884-Prymnesium_polylepis.1
MPRCGMPAQVRSRRDVAANESNTREGCPPVRARKSPGQTQPHASPPGLPRAMSKASHPFLHFFVP